MLKEEKKGKVVICPPLDKRLANQKDHSYSTFKKEPPAEALQKKLPSQKTHTMRQSTPMSLLLT